LAGLTAIGAGIDLTGPEVDLIGTGIGLTGIGFATDLGCLCVALLVVIILLPRRLIFFDVFDGTDI
jgi:hypothetical protein